MNQDTQLIAFQHLLTLLRVALWDTPLPDTLNPADVNWPAVTRHARQQTVSALVGDVMLRYAERLELPDAARLWATKQVAQARQGNIRLNLGVRDVVSHLTAAGVPSVLLKGQGVALSYPKPGLRQCGDIDLYIGLTHYDASIEAMKAASGSEAVEEGAEGEKHYHLDYHGLTVELHRRALMQPMPWQSRAFNRWTVECLESDRPLKVRFDDTDVLLPPADYNAIFLLGHAWHHFIVGGVGLRQVCDWARHLHLHAAELDSADLQRRLQQVGLWTPWRIWASLAVEYLGLPAAECPGYDASFSRRARRAMLHIMQEGNFGQYDTTKTARPRGYFAGKWHTCSENLRRTGSVLNIAPATVLQTFCGYVYDGLHAIVVNDKMGTKPVTVSRSVLEKR
jgi:hypothetical protein